MFWIAIGLNESKKTLITKLLPPFKILTAFESKAVVEYDNSGDIGKYLNLTHDKRT